MKIFKKRKPAFQNDPDNSIDWDVGREKKARRKFKFPVKRIIALLTRRYKIN